MSYKSAKDIHNPEECIDQIQRRLSWLSETGIPQARASQGTTRVEGTHRMVGHCKTDLNRLAELVDEFTTT